MGHCCSRPLGGGKLRHGDSLGGVGCRRQRWRRSEDAGHDRLLRGLRHSTDDLSGGLRWERDEFSRDNNDDIDCVIAKDEFERVPENRGRAVCGQVDGVPDRGRGGHDLSQRGPSGLIELWDGEATPLARIRCEDERAPRVADQRDPIPRGQWRGDEERRDIKEFLEALHLDHAGALKERRHDDLGRGRRSGVRARPPRSSRRDPGLQRHDGLACTDPAGDPCELAGVSEGLEIERDHRGALVALEVAEQIVGADVEAVPDRDEA